MRAMLALALTLLATGCANPVYSQGPPFGLIAGTPVEVGTGSGTIILADVSSDGHLDMLTRQSLTHLVTVQLGDGKGHFAAAAGSPIRLDFPPGDMTLGDVDHDGVPDLGIRKSDRDEVYVFLGKGRGDFFPAPGSPFAASPTVYTSTKPRLHLLDINGDGNLDFVTSNGRSHTLATLLGDGRGRFAPGPGTEMEPGRDWYTSAFGDVDGDGQVDAVTVLAESRLGLRANGRLVVQRGDGTGAFRDASAVAQVSVLPDPSLVTLADVNGDRRPDVVVSHTGHRLSVLLNRGGGRFAPAPTSTYTLGAEAFAVEVADANRDGQADLLAATVSERPPYNGSITVLLGDRRGFTPAPGSPYRAGPGAYNLAVGDVDEDGRLDVAASSFESDAVTVLLGR
jgi:hypothetical protein